MSNLNRYSIASAQDAAARDDLDAWVKQFLASDGSDNEVLGKMLTDDYPFWIGPVELPIDNLHRLAGPADDPAVLVAVEEDEWRDDVADLIEKIDDGATPPPVVATHQGDHLRLEDGNHRCEALRRAGETHAWTIVGFTDQATRDAFIVDGAEAADSES